MKITCNRAALFEAVQLASSIVPTRTPKPILQCAKIHADQQGQMVAVSATDNEISIIFTIHQVQVESGGSTVIPADRMAAILHESSDETVNLELIEAVCQVVGRDSHFRICGHDPDDYPVIEAKQTQEEGIKIQAAVLKRMIHMSVFAAARENTRYAINGVLWERQGKKLRMVATDGRRLAKIDGTTAGQTEGEKTAIVPVKTMQIIERILNDPEEKIQIGFEENKISISTTSVQVMSNLVQGRFPNYSDVIPSDCQKKIKIETELLRSGVRRVALLTNEQSRGVLLSFSEENLRLSSSTPEAGEAEINVAIDYKGEEFNIGFNPQYMLEALRVIEEPTVVFELSNAEKPGVLRAGKDFLYVLMPVSV